MAEIVTMPKLGFDMAEGTLVRWVISEGEEVQKGAVLAEIETDKATVEVESSHSGVVRRHLVEEGTPVPVGDPIAVVGEADEEIDFDQLLGEIAPEAETGLRPAAPTEEQEALPRESAVEEAQPEAEDLEAEEEPVPEREAEPAQVEEAPGDGRFPEGVRASPLARRMAEERRIDLRKVQGSGPRGRITKADIEGYQEAPPEKEERAPAPAAAPAFAAEPREDRRVPLTRLRAIIGRRMVESTNQAPQFYVTHEYDVGALMDLRKQINAALPEEEKTSVNDFIVKAVALALREFPNLNASLDEEKKEVIQHGNINIGNAVAVENGLLTVVVRNADFMPLRQIANEIRAMAGRARDGRVRSEDIEGSTFSISNLGMFAVEHFTAIINPPEAAILAVGSAQQVPVVENGEIKPGWRMRTTISIDHRISDGAEAARFLQSVAKYLEDPLRLLL